MAFGSGLGQIEFRAKGKVSRMVSLSVIENLRTFNTYKRKVGLWSIAQ